MGGSLDWVFVGSYWMERVVVSSVWTVLHEIGESVGGIQNKRNSGKRK